jgi:hypothetical protein
MNGLSKWTHEAKKDTKKGITYVEARPMLCDCGGSVPIGGDGGDVASFFYSERFEWECVVCGRILAPSLRDYKEHQ